MESFENDISRLAGRGKESTGKDRAREADESIARAEKEINEDVRLLLRAIGTRDQVVTTTIYVVFDSHT
jgi:hypothetical protein